MLHVIFSNEKIIPNCPEGWFWLNYLPWLPLLNWTWACTHTHTHTCSHPHKCAHPRPWNTPPGGTGTASEFQRVYTTNLFTACLCSLHFEVRPWGGRGKQLVRPYQVPSTTIPFLQGSNCPHSERGLACMGEHLLGVGCLPLERKSIFFFFQARIWSSFQVFLYFFLLWNSNFIWTSFLCRNWAKPCAAPVCCYRFLKYISKENQSILLNKYS